VIWLLRQENRFRVLPGRKHRIQSIRLHHAERVDALRRDPNARVLFLANHSTHSDPEVMGEVQRRLKMRSCFMAAYDVFERSKFKAWFMQRFGAFSVDRDGSDSKAMKYAMDILKTGRYALTIFPEGNIYFLNDQVCPFLYGASFIALKSQKDLGAGKTVFVVPVSNKFTHLTDQRQAVRDKVASLAHEIGTQLDPDLDLRSEMIRIGEQALETHLEKLGYPPGLPPDRDLVQRLEATARRIIEKLEAHVAVKPPDGQELIDRIRKIRSRIHQIRIDPAQDARCPEATHWAEEAILVLRVLSYSGNYVGGKPTLDRYAETAEKLLEDHTGILEAPWAPRHVHSCVNEPINLAACLDGSKTKLRDQVEQLTRECEASIQSGLDEMNALNTHPGGDLF